METTHDSTAIARGLEDYYFKGNYEGDIKTLGNIFNPGTLAVRGYKKASLMPNHTLDQSS